MKAPGLRIVKKAVEIPDVPARFISDQRKIVRLIKIDSLIAVIQDGGLLKDEIIDKCCFDDIIYLLKYDHAKLSFLFRNKFAVTVF
jgi:hypothetical protein